MFVSTFGQGMSIGMPDVWQDASACGSCPVSEHRQQRNGRSFLFHNLHQRDARAHSYRNARDHAG